MDVRGRLILDVLSWEMKFVMDYVSMKESAMTVIKTRPHFVRQSQQSHDYLTTSLCNINGVKSSHEKKGRL